jgi:hypothetical protein
MGETPDVHAVDPGSARAPSPVAAPAGAPAASAPGGDGGRGVSGQAVRVAADQCRRCHVRFRAGTGTCDCLGPPLRGRSASRPSDHPRRRTGIRFAQPRSTSARRARARASSGTGEGREGGVHRAGQADLDPALSRRAGALKDSCSATPASVSTDAATKAPEARRGGRIVQRRRGPGSP